MSHHHTFDLGNQIAGALVRGVIYQGERRVFHGMSTPAMIAIGLAIVVLVALAARRRWF
ncbi:hypothetical protein BLA39750_01223 [Burkholderia lata]|uniref:Uncharacterized protein n=1 Tax=Burkholderia lata (strain ATCC 17760 / DSM 23089 / LMG 22485 / NCIMB 9086 / R18194 / 383) TaxID=482957 RepID=A0A6P2V0F8_BURL3|nr:hypothetical protein BLA39750_01223 [Burkholderia lata]